MTCAALLRRGTSGGFNTPASVAGLSVWFQADGVLYQDSARTTPAAADGDPVGSWTDGSANAQHANQATSTKRPLLKTNILNGKPVLRFDGVDDHLLVSPFTGASPSTSETVFFVIAVSAATSSAGWLSLSTTGNDFNSQNGIAHTNFGTTTRLDVVRGLATADLVRVQSTTAVSAFAVVEVRFGSGTVTVLLNGASDGTSTFTATTSITPDRLVIAARLNGGGVAGNYLSADVAEVIRYATDVSSTDRSSIRQYLGTKYGITVA